MIYATVNMTIGDYSSTCDNKILLYRGDKNVEIRIVMKGNKFTVLDSTYAQMIIRRPSATSVFSEPAPIQNDTVVFVITEDMIDELKEIGEYTFQIRLYDDTMTARATLPPCKSALIIERPIAVEGEAAVNLAMVNDSAVMLADTTISEEDIFTEDNKYNRTIWVDGDLITDARLNKIEDALYYINENGGGGGGSATAPYISTELPETVMVGSDENFDLHLFFNSPNMGKGTLRVFINDADVMSVKIDQGDSTTVVSNNLFAKGTNRVVVYVLDRVGVMSNSLVFYIRYGSTEISSDFDPYSAYDYGATIRYYFTPTALDTSLSLTFYMSIDGQVQQGVNCTSDTRGYYTFPTNLSADSHYCEAYVVDSKGVKSNVLSFNLIILDADTLVVASDTKEVSVEEGEQVSLDYKVYMKYNTTFISNIYVDDALVNTGTCNADFNYYKTSSLTKGVHTVKLEVFDVTETHSDYITWTVAVSDSTYEMLQPVNAGAMFIGTAVNKTNTDERKQYFIGHDQEGNEVLGTLTNFAFNSESGWVNDELIISGNSHVEIPVQPLANNAKYGFTLDIEFTSKQIGVPDAEVLTLWNDETNCGIKITTEKLILQSSNGNKCDLYFTDNEKTHVMFVIDRQELKAKIYLNGVMCEAFHLNDYTVEGVAYLDDFTVNSNIILGGLNTNGYCKIRNLRVYQVALTTDEIMNNFISCEIDKAKQRELSEFQKGNDLPTLYVYCDFSGLGKDDKKPCKIVYNSTNEALYGKSFNLDHKQSQLQYQGTSSMAYPIKNYRLNLRDENGDKWYYTLPTAQPECRFTLKADFMSSGHWTNTGMAKFINDKLYNYNVNDEKSMNPFKWDHVQNGGKVTDFRETISGFPCRLILVNDGETPLNTGQNEPTPGNTKDMGIFNFNNDKDNVTTLGFNSDIFPNCASYEVTANSDTSAGAFMSYKERKIFYTPSNDKSASLPLSEFGLAVGDTFVVSSEVETPGGSIGLEYIGANYVMTSPTPKTAIVPDGATGIRLWFQGGSWYEINGIRYVKSTDVPADHITCDQADELAYLKESFELRHPDKDDVAEDWGFMGVEDTVLKIDEFLFYGNIRTSKMEASYFNSDSITITFDNNVNFSFVPTGDNVSPQYDVPSGTTISLEGVDRFNLAAKDWTYVDINGNRYYKGITREEGVATKEENPYESTIFNTSYSLKALIDWVDNCTDEEFVADFEEHFHKDYTLRYFCLVTLIGAVDNLGKNMMLDTADNKIFFPRFYDIDTICSYDNSGQLKFDVDIEMEQGYWNTSSSRLWTRVRDLMHDDIVTTYNDMRQNGVSYENMMHYIYDEQIAKIPQAYYNKDYDVKYAPFADSYIGMAHGDTYEHVKRWLKQRFAFVDTLFDYAPSYNNDILTIRVNTTEEITLHLETYTPVYQHLSWYNGQMDKKKIDGKTSITFSGKVQAATDQEVLIYGGSNIKKITGIQSGNPNRLILGSATKLTELDASNCPLLAEINMNKANLSPHEYLNKVNLSNCPLLEGNLRLNNSPLIQELDIRGTKITGMNLPSSIRNLQVLKLPNTMTELTLNDAGMLHTLEFDEGVALQSISMTNCNALTNVVNFDLLQTPSITLNNSYNSVAELYFRDTTNLALSNMSNLERVIFTPNNEYETFELINVANAPDYKVTTFNCPKLSTFMTTAPYRESYMVNAKYLGLKLPGKTRTELEYLQSDGSQYFDTGITPKTGDVIVMDLDMDKRSDVNYDYFIGGNGAAVQFDNNRDDQLSVRGCTISPRETPNGNIPACNVSERNTYTVSITANEDHTLKIFAGAYQGTFETHNKGVGKLYSFKYYSNNRLMRDYIPCKDEDGIVCLYDNINNKFLYPDGTLIAGSEADVSDKLVEAWDKDYGNIQPNTTFTANSIDISNTQFTDVKLLCTTDTNTLKLPTTVKNFYCDSSFDLDTDYLEDGEYDVVHGELVEPYTTDYEGEVKAVESTLVDYDLNILREYSDPPTGEFLEVVPNSSFSFTTTKHVGNVVVGGYDENKNFVKYLGGGYNAPINNTTITYPIDNSSIRYIQFFNRATNNTILTLTYSKPVTPNLIPSSADGSLIFSMYAPSNTVAPASGTWDLHGLEFDNFHTFGMNNDVIYTQIYNEVYHVGYCHNNSTGKSVNGYIPLYDTITDVEIYGFYSNGMTGQSLSFYDENKVKLATVNHEFIIADNKNGYGTLQIDITKYPTATMFRLESTDVQRTYWKIGNALYYFGKPDSKVSLESWMTLPTLKSRELVYEGLTMPARYDDYNITIKNAYIAPKTHNTMLYPLLVNEDNPITGTLDYTNYAGKHLSWSFAYTDEEYANIIQPKDELLNSYEYKYNAFYDTEYEFDNPYEIARYTSSASGVLPTFNTEFTYTYDETNNGDGTYTVSIATDSLDNLPTKISFTANTNLLTVDKLNTSKVTTMLQMFRSCGNLTRINCRLDTSSVTNEVSQAFLDCKKLEYLDMTGFIKSNIKYATTLFQGCETITHIVGLDTWDISSITDFSNMFANCYALSDLTAVENWDMSNAKVLDSMFARCNAIESFDLTKWDVSNVTNMRYMFGWARGPVSIDMTGWDTSNVENMYYMFGFCNKLTEIKGLENFNTSKVTNMQYMLSEYQATELDLSRWDVGNVTNMGRLFEGCVNLQSLNISGWKTSNVTNMQGMFTNCPSLTELDLSGFDTSNVTDMSHMFKGCRGLTHLDVSGNYVKRSELDDVIRQINVLRSDVDSLLQNRGEVLYYDPTMSIENDRATNGFDTNNVTNMESMFQDCSNLTELDLSTFNTSKVTNMGYMFYGCSKLTSLDLSKWDASKVENMNHAFCNCSSITELNLSRFTNVKDWGSFCRYCTKLVSITGLDISKYSTNFGGNDQQYLSFLGCTSLRSIKDLNVSFTSAMAKANSNSINNDYWMLCSWGWFNGLTNLVDITFTGQVELYDTMLVYYIFRGCDTTKFTHATWNTFVSIFPTTSTSKSIVLGGTQAILEAVPDEIKLALTQKGYTLIFRE